MRYHYDKPAIYSSLYGITYVCNHPVYDNCTLYSVGDKGLAVIQQRYDPESKTTWWNEIDPWLTDTLYLHPGFKEFFEKRSGAATDGIFPTVTIRQIMWALKLKPLQKERWETCFDRKNIQFAKITGYIMKEQSFKFLSNFVMNLNLISLDLS